MAVIVEISPNGNSCATTGSVSMETVKSYIEGQRTDEHKRNYYKSGKYIKSDSSHNRLTSEGVFSLNYYNKQKIDIIFHELSSIYSLNIGRTSLT